MISPRLGSQRRCHAAMSHEPEPSTMGAFCFLSCSSKRDIEWQQRSSKSSHLASQTPHARVFPCILVLQVQQRHLLVSIEGICTTTVTHGYLFVPLNGSGEWVEKEVVSWDSPVWSSRFADLASLALRASVIWSLRYGLVRDASTASPPIRVVDGNKYLSPAGLGEP